MYGIPDVESFEATFHEKLKLKPQERWFTTLRLQCIVRHTLGKVTVYLRKKIGPVRVIVIKGGRRLQEN